MADVIVIGDGPGGLSAALFLAKKGLDTLVFGQDQTPMHKAVLHNYLGVPDTTGSDFQTLARKQVTDMGAKISDDEVAAVEQADGGFRVTANGTAHEARYLIIAAGPNPAFAEALGLSLTQRKTVDADRDGRTAVDNVYAIGWSTRPDKIQAIISAGDGGAAALDIISREAGKEIHDFDVVE